MVSEWLYIAGYDFYLSYMDIWSHKSYDLIKSRYPVVNPRNYTFVVRDDYGLAR